MARKIARDLAFEFFEQGKRPSDPEIKALGLKPKTTYNYFQEWKKLAETTSKLPEGSPPQPQRVVAGRSIEVGKITITPENWGFTQYGAILVLDTYNKAKRDINYGGTVGDFICDICEFYRRILNYREVDYVRTAGEGGGGTEEDGGQGIGSAG